MSNSEEAAVTNNDANVTSQPKCPPRPTIIPRKKKSGSLKSNQSIESADNGVPLSSNTEQCNDLDLVQREGNIADSIKNEDSDQICAATETNIQSEKILKEAAETNDSDLMHEIKNEMSHGDMLENGSRKFSEPDENHQNEVGIGGEFNTSTGTNHTVIDPSINQSKRDSIDVSSNIVDENYEMASDVVAPKPLTRLSTQPDDSSIQKNVPESDHVGSIVENSCENHEEVENSDEDATNKKSKPKTPARPPPLKPRSNPPPKPRLVPPPPPQIPPNFHSNSKSPPQSHPSNNSTSKPSLPPPPQHIVISDSDKSTTPQSAKNVTRKESASKKIDMIKKKGLKIKKRSIDMFKSRSNHGDSQESTDTLEITSPLSPESKLSQTGDGVSEKQEVSDAASNKPALAKSAEKSKRAPPPRPALPTVLRNRKSSEPNTSIGKSANSCVERSSSTNVRPTWPAAIDVVPKDEDMQPTPLETSSFNSNDGDVLVNDCHNVLCEKISDGSDSENIDEKNGSADMNESCNDVTSPKPTAKPARPPPIQLSDSTMLISIKKKPANNENADEEASLFDMLKGKDGETPKSAVDQQMKDFISGELFCVAIQDYEATNFTDISFAAGERILVQKQLDDGILFGRNENGEEGPFPGKFVRLEDS